MVSVQALFLGLAFAAINAEPDTDCPTAKPTPCPTGMPVPADRRFCSQNQHAISEYNGDLYSDVLRKNDNELFSYDPSTKLIKSKSGGKCLDVSIDGASKYQLHTWDCDASNKNQQWSYDEPGHTIRHLGHSGICLSNDANSPGKKAFVEPCNNSFNQYFGECASTSNVHVTFQTCSANKVLSEGWTGLWANTAQGTINEIFEYDASLQHIIAKSNHQCLDAFSTGNGKFGLHTYDCDVSNQNQKWILESNRVKHAVHPNLCLDADPTDPLHKAQVWECFPNNNNQCWKINRLESTEA
ncbi:hypothetical protein THRCLA_03219 [Thraustotheca clavata]|uniref:Secreted protein n=1 Tax=Thraustotheca clavata TaxID=74557 RepID=A0A0A7CLZ9_9STRA|nr:secreted protein [Thraustotheca clavata]OQS04557.1 hypothetical protein THRCLA_03219 [Thraustotheca clavata]